MIYYSQTGKFEKHIYSILFNVNRFLYDLALIFDQYTFLILTEVACDISNTDDNMLDRLCGQINGESTLETLVRGRRR